MRGGKRQGTSGQAYGQRTDLHGTVPIAATPGQQYGAAKAQIDSQRAVPMAANPLQSSSPQGSLSLSAPVGPLPGQLGDLTGPTDRPNEHLMTGVNAGLGAGSEVLQPSLPADPTATALGLLNSLGDVTSSQVQYIRNFLALQAENNIPR